MLADGQLPRPESAKDAKALRKAGVKVHGHGLLLQATLPAGWCIVQTESRHGQLIDGKGRVRAELFYKGSPHDTKGHLRMLNRYTTYKHPVNPVNWCAWDCATNRVLFEDTTVCESEQYARAKAWLKKHRPKWQDPSKYWDDTTTSFLGQRLWRR